IDALTCERCPRLAQAGDILVERTQVRREIDCVDRAHRRAGDDREGEPREALRESRQNADLVRAPRAAAAQHEREVGRVAPDPRRPFVGSGTIDWARRWNVANAAQCSVTSLGRSQLTHFRSSTKVAYNTGTSSNVTNVATVSPPICA